MKTDIEIIENGTYEVKLRISNKYGEDILVLSQTNEGHTARIEDINPKNYELLCVDMPLIRKKTGALQNQICLLEDGAFIFYNLRGECDLSEERFNECTNIYKKYKSEVGYVYNIGDKVVTVLPVYDNKGCGYFNCKELEVSIE